MPAGIGPLDVREGGVRVLALRHARDHQLVDRRAPVDHEVGARIDRLGVDSQIGEHRRRGDVELPIGAVQLPPRGAVLSPRGCDRRPHAGVTREHGLRSRFERLEERDHGRPAEVVRELPDAGGPAFELGWRQDRGLFPKLRRARIDPDLPVGQVGRLSGLLRVLGRRDDDDRRRDAEREGDSRQGRSGTGLIADQVSQRQSRRDGDSPSQAGEDANGQRAHQQAAEDGRHDPGDDERRPVSPRERQTADADGDQDCGRKRSVACGPRLRRSPGEREHHGDAGDRSRRPPGGGGGPEDREQGGQRDQPPGKAEPVDAMSDRRLERRGEGDP